MSGGDTATCLGTAWAALCSGRALPTGLLCTAGLGARGCCTFVAVLLLATKRDPWAFGSWCSDGWPHGQPVALCPFWGCFLLRELCTPRCCPSAGCHLVPEHP